MGRVKNMIGRRPFYRLNVVGPGEAAEPVPVLQRCIRSQQKSAGQPEPVGTAIAEFTDEKRFPENPGRHHCPRELSPAFDGVSLSELPAAGSTAQRYRMIEITMVVDQVKFFSGEGKSDVIQIVETGDRTAQLEFLFGEAKQFLQTRILLCLEKIQKFPTVVACAGIRTATLLLPDLEPFQVELRRGLRHRPVRVKNIFIHQIDHGQSRFFPPGEAGIRIPVPDPSAGELLPMSHRTPAYREERFVFTVSERVTFRNCVSGFGQATVIQVKRNVDAVAFQGGNQIIKPVEGGGVECQSICRILLEDTANVMEPDEIVSVSRKFNRQTVCIFPFREQSRHAEVDPEKSGAPFRRVGKRESSVRGRGDEAILSGGFRSKCGKIQRTARRRARREAYRDPVSSGNRCPGTFFGGHRQNRLLRKRDGGNQPQHLGIDRPEREFPGIIPLQRKAGNIQTDFVFRIMAAPRDRAVGERTRQPPVADIPAGNDRDRLL